MRGRYTPLTTLEDEDADFDSMMTHFNKAVTDTAAERLANNIVRGSPGLHLRPLMFVTKTRPRLLLRSLTFVTKDKTRRRRREASHNR